MSLVSQISTLAERIAAEIVLRGTPPGGTSGQVLAKSTEQDFDVVWQTRPGTEVLAVGAPLPGGLPDGTLIARV